MRLKPIQQGSQCSTASGALSSTHQHPTWLVSRRARALLSHATRTLATGRVRQHRLHTGNNPRPCGRARSSPARRVIPCAGRWRGHFDADIASQALNLRLLKELGSRRTLRFASTKILVQTQWEAVRFDRVKHTAGTQATHGLRCGFRIQGLGGFHPVHSYNLNCTKESSSSTSHVPATLALSSYGIRAGRVPLGVP